MGNYIIAYLLGIVSCFVILRIYLIWQERKAKRNIIDFRFMYYYLPILNNAFIEFYKLEKKNKEKKESINQPEQSSE